MSAPNIYADFFEEAKRLVESAVKVASSKEDALQIRGILGEVLRAKGDLDDAVFVLRGALAEEGWGADDTVDIFCFVAKAKADVTF